jgi:hypothetical protein
MRRPRSVKDCRDTGWGHYIYLHLRIQITRFRYPRFRLSAVLFQCHEEHQYPIRGQILKPITCVEHSPDLSGNVMQMISLTSKSSGASLTSKWRLLYISRFPRFQYTRRFAGTQPPCITRVTGICTFGCGSASRYLFSTTIDKC